jgi:hypothetical protein
MGDSEIEGYKKLAEQCERTAESLPTFRKSGNSKSWRNIGAIWPNTLSAEGKSDQKGRADDPDEVLRFPIRVRSV